MTIEHVLAVPAQTLRQNLSGWAPLLPGTALLVSLMKGIELGTHRRMSQVIAQVTFGPLRFTPLTLHPSCGSVGTDRAGSMQLVKVVPPPADEARD